MARWHCCNVLQVGADRRRVWQFDARNGGFALNREQAAPDGTALPYALVTKTWRSLWQPKLNIAWLAPDQVFLRVIQIPKSTLDETCSMVELQLERLSPIPVTQAVWSLHVMPQAAGELQTVIVVLAEREAVEQFLGQLEGQGYLADRLEVPVLDQLQATAAGAEGAWVFPASTGLKSTALVAWWQQGVLQSLSVITLPGVGDRPAALRAQLAQITWAGELEGWISGTPAWHLVADETTTEEWEKLLRQAVDAAVQLVPSLPPAQLAALTAQRAASAPVKVNLLPPEFSTRYTQQFHDRLWMRGLGAIVSVYVVGVVIYLVALGVFGWRTQAVETKAKSLGPAYTNAMQLEARLDVLKDRQALKFAALDSWKAVAETLPGELQLEGFNFSDGRKLQLNGTAPAGSEKAILDFSDELRKVRGADGQPLFGKTEIPNWTTSPGGGLSWRFNWELKRTEAP